MSRTYDSSTVLHARKLAEAGWKTPTIVRLLEKERGVRPQQSTVRDWIDPEYAQRRRQNKRVRPWHRPYARLVELRDLGISCHAIAVLLANEHGLEISEDQVRRIVEGRAKDYTIQRVLTPPPGAEA